MNLKPVLVRSFIACHGNREVKCLSLMDEIVDDSGGRRMGAPRVSMYDIRSFETRRTFPPGHAKVEVSVVL